MKGNSDANGGPQPPHSPLQPGAPELAPQYVFGANPNGAPAPKGRPRAGRVDLWTVLDLLAQRWHWLAVGSLVCATGFFLLAYYVIQPKFTATAQLLRFEAVGRPDYIKPAPISAETFAGLIRSPELLRWVSEQAVERYGLPAVPPEKFVKFSKVEPEADSDLVTVILAARQPAAAVQWLNLYLTNAVSFTRELEAKQAALLAQEYLKKEIAEWDNDISALQEQFRNLPLSPQASNRLAQVGSQLSAVSSELAGSARPSMLGVAKQAERLQKALAELDDLSAKYTDLHPDVQAKQQQVARLQGELASASTNRASAALANPLGGLADTLNPELDIIHIKLRSLQDARQDLLKRQREAELYATNPPGSVRLFAPATLATVRSNLRPLKIGLVTIFGGLLGLGCCLGLVLLVEFADNRLKTAEDVLRVTQLPVLSALGNLKRMTPEARAQWGFRAWTMLQGRLSSSANHGLVCGITSSAAGEGRSTWISLLAEAASLTGFRVLTIAAQSSPPQLSAPAEAAAPEEPTTNGSSNHSHALTTNVLSSPWQVTEQLVGPNSQPLVHIPLPGWVWNLERRKQWREALNQWRQIDNLVIFVELPPASVPEAVLLGSNLPNLIWLTESGAAHAGQTLEQLTTLRDARCNLVGAALNREPSMPIRKRFPRWLSCLAFPLALGLCSVQGQEVTPATQPASTAVNAPILEGPAPGSFSIVNPSQRAPWQQHLTLGPGDVLTFNLYGQPELVRTEVAIGPDGHVSYLEAQDIEATGLTIDELRGRCDQELSKYRRAPRTVITPVSFKSKKYYMLGKVVGKGVYALDRPLTVLEALARARGLESALVERNVLEMTDFQRSFLARGGKRIALNFERLFQQGDLSQNLAVEPGDYIYFAPGNVDEVYVVGEVRLPGSVPYTSSLTLLGALSARGGYTERAYRARVLVVRGSLNNHPETHIVDTHAVLDAKALDFKLRPKDIVFVNSRPFIKVEEAADLAATAFIQAVITSWVGVDVVKPF